jgi:hypothetical protein
VCKTKDGEKEKEPGSQRHHRVGLKSEKEFPEKLWPLKIINKSEDSNDHREGGDIGSDSGDVLISIFAEEVGCGRYDKSPSTQSGSE